MWYAGTSVSDAEELPAASKGGEGIERQFSSIQTQHQFTGPRNETRSLDLTIPTPQLRLKHLKSCFRAAQKYPLTASCVLFSCRRSWPFMVGAGRPSGEGKTQTNIGKMLSLRALGAQDRRAVVLYI